MVVLGVEHLGDDLRHGGLLTGLEVAALAEEVHVDGLGTLGVPEAEDIGVVGVVAGDLHVAGHGQDAGVALVHHVEAVVVPELTEGAAEVDLLGLLGTGHQPSVAHALPVIGELHLLAVHDLLLEDT